MHQYYRRVSYPLLNEGIVRDALWEDLEGEKRRSRALHKIGGRGVGVGGLGGRREDLQPDKVVEMLVRRLQYNNTIQ